MGDAGFRADLGTNLHAALDLHREEDCFPECSAKKLA